MIPSAAHLFDLNGYYRGEQLVEPPLLDRMERVVRDQLDRAVPPYRVNHKGEACRLDHLAERDSVFLEALRTEAVMGPLAQILGPRISLVRHRHNHATRNAPGDIPFRLHRDIQQWSQPLVSIFIYLDESTIDNGCTCIVPGTHRLPYAGPQSLDGGGNWADEHDEYRPVIGQELPIEMPRGGVLLLNSLAFHSVGPRGGPRDRGATRYSMVFACHSTNELSTANSPDEIVLIGERRRLSNDALRVSGSLERGDMPR